MLCDQAVACATIRDLFWSDVTAQQAEVAGISGGVGGYEASDGRCVGQGETNLLQGEHSDISPLATGGLGRVAPVPLLKLGFELLLRHLGFGPHFGEDDALSKHLFFHPVFVVSQGVKALTGQEVRQFLLVRHALFELLDALGHLFPGLHPFFPGSLENKLVVHEVGADFDLQLVESAGHFLLGQTGFLLGFEEAGPEGHGFGQFRAGDDFVSHHRDNTVEESAAVGFFGEERCSRDQQGQDRERGEVLAATHFFPPAAGFLSPPMAFTRSSTSWEDGSPSTSILPNALISICHSS